jgi:hypothetical protein
VRKAPAEAGQAHILERLGDLAWDIRAAVFAILSGNATLPSTVMCGNSA